MNMMQCVDIFCIAMMYTECKLVVAFPSGTTNPYCEDNSQYSFNSHNNSVKNGFKKTTFMPKFDFFSSCVRKPLYFIAKSGSYTQHYSTAIFKLISDFLVNVGSMFAYFPSTNNNAKENFRSIFKRYCTKIEPFYCAFVTIMRGHSDSSKANSINSNTFQFIV